MTLLARRLAISHVHVTVSDGTRWAPTRQQPPLRVEVNATQLWVRQGADTLAHRSDVTGMTREGGRKWTVSTGGGVTYVVERTPGCVPCGRR